MKKISKANVDQAGRGNILSLLKSSGDVLDYTQSIEVSDENDIVIIKAPVMVALEIAVNTWKSFVYTGLSYDYMMLQPSFQSASNVTDVKMAKLTIATLKDPKHNQLSFKIKRR